MRSGEWTQVRIWSIVDLGTMKRQDLFITDSRLEAIVDFESHEEYSPSNWDGVEYVNIMKKMGELNGLLANN